MYKRPIDESDTDSKINMRIIVYIFIQEYETVIEHFVSFIFFFPSFFAMHFPASEKLPHNNK